MWNLRGLKGVGIGAIVGATLATVVGVSAHGGDTTLIHACVGPSGSLRIIGPSDTCGRNETALDWNVQGIKGDKGDTGNIGPKGDKGDTGNIGPKGDTGNMGPKGDKGDTGEVGPAGTFTGTFVSGGYSLMVTETGIELSGPSGSFLLGPNGIAVNSSKDLVLKGKEVLLESEDDLALKGGKDVVLEGTDMVLNAESIAIKAVGDVTIKGSKIGNN